jgi:hypothetical protein
MAGSTKAVRWLLTAGCRMRIDRFLVVAARARIKPANARGLGRVARPNVSALDGATASDGPVRGRMVTAYANAS